MNWSRDYTKFVVQGRTTGGENSPWRDIPDSRQASFDTFDEAITHKEKAFTAFSDPKRFGASETGQKIVQLVGLMYDLTNTKLELRIIKRVVHEEAVDEAESLKISTGQKP